MCCTHSINRYYIDNYLLALNRIELGRINESTPFKYSYESFTNGNGVLPEVEVEVSAGARKSRLGLVTSEFTSDFRLQKRRLASLDSRIPNSRSNVQIKWSFLESEV